MAARFFFRLVCIPWQILHWAIPVSWWLNRATSPRRAAAYIWTASRLYGYSERAHGNFPGKMGWRP